MEAAILAGMEDQRNLVPDEATALTVGVAILTAYYGREVVDRFRPYRAASLSGNWAIMGRPATHEQVLDQERLVVLRDGGAPEVLIAREDSRVLSIQRSR